MHCWWEWNLAQPPWKTVWKVFSKLNRELPYDLAVPFLGIYLQKTKTQTGTDIHTPVIMAALLKIAKTYKPPTFSWMNEWMKKL